MVAAHRDLTDLTATEAVEKLRAREVSPMEMLEAVLARMDEVEPEINAVPTLCRERAMKRAREIDQALANGTSCNDIAMLAGLPIVVKDLVEVAGVRTTFGSPIHADYVPEKSDILVDILESRGAVVVGKSNTPEFGAGGNTFNEVFGATVNPWDHRKTCGGSSGGSAAALAAGEIHLATGSDLGGSLRMPASFCSVVGLRPSPGRVAHGPALFPFNGLPVDGPMARNIRDTALMLDCMTGLHPADPLSLPGIHDHTDALDIAPPKRVAYSPDLGITPVEPEIDAICRGAAQRFEELGTIVDAYHPDFGPAREVFHQLRAFFFSGQFAPLIEKMRDQFKPEIIWNVEQGLKATARELTWAERERGALYARMVDFFNDYDLLLCPATVVPPFNVEERYVTEVDGHHFDNYIDWFAITYVVTLTALPVLSLPCGFTEDGLPVGLQIIGPPRDERSLLGWAGRLEEVLGIADRVPVANIR